jgi:hypothetical protein
MSNILDIHVVSSTFDIMSNVSDIADEPGAGLTFKEKSLWVTLIATSAIYGAYFWHVLSSDAGPGRAGAWFASTVVAMIAVHLISHAALALHRRPERSDERDRQIARIGARNAYYVLMSSTWGALGVAATALGTFWCVQAVLAAIVIAELTRCASQLVYYRRGLAT